MESYSLYVHIPFCKARCSYCAFSSCTEPELMERYLAKLFAEAERCACTQPIHTLYIGGGTPSVLPVRMMDALFDKLRRCFDLTQLREATVECNPESASQQLLACLRSNGVDRLSFGLQSANNSTLAAVGRLHTYEQFLAALDRARAQGFANINADLILGLPESRAQFSSSLSLVAELPLTHVSVYALELHEGTPLHAKLDGKQPFDDDEMADMYDEAVEVLASHGFARYEISNFARPGCECLHNLHYWQEGRYFALGAAAGGFVGDVRFTNVWDVHKYIAAPLDELHEAEEHVSLAEQANELVMLGLRLESGVDRDLFAKRFGADFWDFFAEARRLAAEGFLTEQRGRVRVPADKLYVVNSILADLLDF